MALSRHPGIASSVTTKCTKCATTFGHANHPRLLKCLHGICSSCLTDLSSLGPEVKCPVCDDKTNVKDSRAALSLPVDYATLKAILFLELTDSQGKIKCDKCPKEDNATSRCLDCRMYMCDTCKLFHERFSKYFSEKHVVVALADLLEKPDIIISENKQCDYHWMKETFFCKTCEVPVCSSCLRITHARHTALDIKNPHDKATGKVSNINIKLINDQSDIASSRRVFSHKVEDVNIKIANKVNDIGETFHQVIQTLEERKRFLLSKVQENAGEELEIITGKMGDVRSRIRRSKDALSKSESVLQECAAADIITMKDVITSRLVQLQKEAPLVFIVKNIHLERTGFDTTEKLVSKLCYVSDDMKSSAAPKTRHFDFRDMPI
ncbi:tripartite motif-containing protein 45-like [Haliotis rubra]|uniref:tripartite motif-containing protein 45-like n=1 Tax=Haliotis rubra TaxID=36100 RepID=UPI001EE5DD37|nr:tripartite motif-containing protein 45-like [Haliotis rubra]